MPLDLGPLRALVLDINLTTHGIPMTVTRPAPDDEPIETRGIWMTPDTSGFPVGSDFSDRAPVHILALSRLAVPTVPKGTLVVGPEQAGGADKLWRVDVTDRQEADHTRVIVLDVTEE